MTTSTKPLHEERIEEPAKAWRNWFRIPDDAKSLLRKPGEVYHSADSYRSKAEAERAVDGATLEAAKFSVKIGNKPFARISEYLGAFPEGQRP